MEDNVMIDQENIISSSPPVKRKVEVLDDGEILIVGKVIVSVDNLRCTALQLDNDIPDSFQIETNKQGEPMVWMANPQDPLSKYDLEALEQIKQNPELVEFRSGTYKTTQIWSRRKKQNG